MGLPACYQAHDEGSEGSGRKPTLGEGFLDGSRRFMENSSKKKTKTNLQLSESKIRKTTRRTLTSPQHCCSDRSL